MAEAALPLLQQWRRQRQQRRDMYLDIGTQICSTTRILQVERATRKLAEEEEERKVEAAKKKEEEDERAKLLTLTAAERAEVKQVKAALVKSKT